MLTFRWYLLCWCFIQCAFQLTADSLCRGQELGQQDSGQPDSSQEEQKQRETIARFVAVLEKNPRRGTALDRVYGHHVEFGTLDSFAAQLKDRASAPTSSGESWMILGMIEYQRGNDAQAVDAFTKAEMLRTKDPLTSYYLGQSQLRIGDSSAAVASFERALERKPQRTDELEIFQQLGRVHQRAQRTDEAMKVWKRLEGLYPDDPRVLEQIAVTLAEEGQFAEALPRYEKLAATSKDDYRKTTFAVTAAELTVKQGDKPEGIRRMEALLADLNPDGWLYRDVRRRIDDCFLRTGDQDGLVSYYQAWLESHPKDIEAMNRLARFLKQSARNPEAATWLNKALASAPKREDIRKTYIELLAEDKRFEDAAAQYEQLLKTSPNNADYLRDWGKMVLRNKGMPEAERRVQALAIWNRMLEPNPNDAVMVAQIADFCRQNQMLEQAESLYRKAVDLAPSEPQYREYLGEFLSIQKRPEEAKTAWQQIAQGDRRNTDNLARLAEIYNSFGYGEEACLNIAQAIELSPKDFALVLKGAQYHNKSTRFDEAIKLVDQAEKLAANDEEQESVLNTRIEVLQSSQQIESISEAIEKQLTADPATKASEWYRLARYQEAQRKWDNAAATIDKAIAKDPQSILALTAAARIAESAGDFGRASDLFRKLTQVDRRSISDHWTSVTRLETQLGRKAQALDAAKQLIVAAPSKTENYEFYAQTCLRLGETEEGMQALRKAIRINPNEPGLMMALGNALADQMRTDEAIELYWRAYEKSEELTDKSTMVTKLVPLYSQINQFETLIERLERERQDEESRRSATICIAQAWQTAGDIAQARKELEGLLGENSKDTNLLNQLAKLCESDSDMEAAINYRRQLVSLAPGDETEAPLAAMLLNVGEVDEAKAIYAKLIEAEEDPVRQLRSLDSLLNSGNFDTALRVIEPLLEKQRDDWELLYRYGVCWTNLKNDSEAKARFERILSLSIPHETLGRSAQAKLKQAQEKAKSDNLRGIATALPASESALQMTQQSQTVRRAVGLEQEDYYGNASSTLWTPPSYGVARMAALGWLLKMEQDADESQAIANAPTEPSKATATLADSVRDKSTAVGTSKRDLLDWLYVCALKNDYPQIFSISKQLAQSGGIDEKRFFLQSLPRRNYSESLMRGYGGDVTPAKTPLDDADLDFMQKCYDEVAAKQKNQDLNAIYGSNLAYDDQGQAYIMVGSGYQALPGVFRNSMGSQNQILEEYRTAGKTARVKELIQQQIDSAKSADDWIAVMRMLRAEKRESEIPDTIEKWAAAAKKQIAETPVTTNRGQGQSNQAMPLVIATDALQQWIGQLGSEEENDRVLQMLDTILPVAIAEGKYRVQAAAAAKTSPASTSNTNQQAGNVEIQIYYGKTQTRVNVVFPPVSREIDTPAVTILRQFFEVLSKNDVSQDMVNRLRDRSQMATDDVEFWRWYLASVLWWSDEQDEAMQVVTKIIAEHPNEPRMQFRWASLLESREEFEEALSIIDQITPRDQNQLIRRETYALRLAERIGDTDRAKQSAERLFGLRLTNDAQMQLLPQLKRLGMDAQADALLARLERTSARQSGNQVNLMSLYQSQGKTEIANQIALAILRRSASPYAATQNSSRTLNPRSFQRGSSNSFERNAALAQLASSGALKKMIESLKEKLAKSPDSIYTLEQLIEYSAAANQKEQADEYLTKAIALRPDSHILRWNLANNLMDRNKYNEACDQYLILFDAQPNWIAENFYEVSRAFSQAKRQKELMAKCQTIDLKRFRDPWQLMNMVRNSIREEPGSAEAFIPLIERLFEADPSNRNYILGDLVNQPELAKNEKIYALIKRSVIPQSQAIAASGPWMGLDRITGYSADGSVSLGFTYLLQFLQSNPSRREDLEKAIEAQVQRSPQWRAGPVMLALIDMAGTKKEQGRKQLESILTDEKSWDDIPIDTCWFLGQEISDIESSEDLALRLLKRAELKHDSRRMSDNLQFSPIASLAKIASKRPEERAYVKKRIDERLREQANQPTSYVNDEYEAYRRIQRAISTSGLFQSLDYPIDAYLAVRKLEDDPDMKKATRYYGGIESLKTQIDQKIATSKKAITDRSLIDSLERLLPENKRLDLMVSYPSQKAKENQKVESGLLEVLRLAITKPETIQLITDRLKLLTEQRPNDLSVNLVRVLWMLEQDCQGEVLAPELEKLLELAKLEPIAPGRRANNRQRQEAQAIADLWILAREILRDPSTINADAQTPSSAEPPSIQQPPRTRPYASHPESRRLALQAANLAAEASMRKLAGAEQYSLLLELAEIQTQQKEWDQAEKSWERLLALATTKASKSKGETKTEVQTPSTKPILEPPLTISQFRTVMRVYSMAASSGRSDIATKALTMSLRGGMPVPDPQSDLPDPSLGLMAMGPPGINNAPAKDPIETEVQNLIKKAFTSGGNSSDTPAELYDPLRLIALPTNRPDEIRLYVNSTAVESGRAESLATSLVRAAAKAGKLDALQQEVQARETKEIHLLSKKALLALIAIESGDMAVSKTVLDELAQQSGKLATDTALKTAGLAALKAFTQPELRQAALPIMRRLVTKSLAMQNESDSRFSYSNLNQPLMTDFVTSFNRYLAGQGDSKGVRENFDAVLQSRSRLLRSIGEGDYARAIQRRDLRELAKYAVQMGLNDYAWELLGRCADIPDAPQYTPSGDSEHQNPALEYLVRWQRTRPAQERYRTWFEWTMPNAQRSSVRTLDCNIRTPKVPSLFLQSTERGRILGEPTLKPGMISNLTQLVWAADQCNELPNLKQQVEALDGATDPNVNLLMDLIFIQQKNHAEVSKRVAQRMVQFANLNHRISGGASEVDYGKLSTDSVRNAMIATACKESGYDDEADKLQSTAPLADPMWPPSVRDETHWLIANYYSWWRYPLVGDFTLSWDCPIRNLYVEYGGVRIDTQQSSLSDSSGLIRNVPRVRTLSNNPRAEIQVAENQVTFKIDGQAITTESSSGTSPWLALGSYYGKGSQWRNLRIEGNPSIPSEVPLISNDSMDGWSSAHFSEIQDPRIDQEAQPKPIAWLVDQSQIRGKPIPKTDQRTKESWLTYQRPLAQGETFRYEFFANGNQMVAHPTLGDTALILSPEGLQLHYVPVNEAVRTLYDLDTETMIDVEPSQLKVDRLPIKDQDWNQVSLTHQEKQIDLSINGLLVYSLPLESNTTTQFGIFRYQHQECLVRNAILSGPWPQSISEALIADVNAKNPAYRNGIPTNQSFSYRADTLRPGDWRQAAQNGDPESLRTLLELVLPTDAKYPRMSFELSEDSTDTSVGRIPMKMDCVAVELARCAQRNNLSGDVLQAIETFEKKNPQAKRTLDALRCLIAIESPDDKPARLQMQGLIEALNSNENDLHDNVTQTANFIVAKRASSVPGLRDLALAMTEKLQKTAIEKRDKTQNKSLMTLTNDLYGDLKFAIESDWSPKNPPSGQQWTILSSARRTSTSEPDAILQTSTWVTNRGKAAHYGANQRSLLIFQSPLVGNFEVVAERTTWDRQEMAILYAGHSAEPKYDLSAVLVTDSKGQTEKGSALEVPGFRDKGQARFRIAASDGRITTYTNDVQIHEQSVSNASFPWLVLRPAYPEFCGQVEDLRIIGSPSIPEELDLTGQDSYIGWDGSVTGRSIGRENERMGYDWTFRDNQLIAIFNSSSEFFESYIRYKRPMLEDGVVEYEFQYNGTSDIHPAIGSYAFLIRPEGIQLHRITPLADDVPALLTNNAAPLEPPSKPLELKKNDFNHVRLELKGDDVSISINNNLVATVRINDPANKRHIGLLCIDGITSVVRNMKYRGQWPKTLPSVSEQWLAKP